MLPRSFLFLPGIGPVREARLWRRGVESWAHYRDLPRVQGIRPKLKERHDDVLALAERALGRDPAFFARLLPSAEHWRAYDFFGEGAAFVDIETTGDRANQITVVGVRRRGESVAFVRGLPERLVGRRVDGSRQEAYSPKAVTRFLADASCLVTFNGASFDLPVIAGEGTRLPDTPHVDLRLVFSRIGMTGGLKKIEDAMGLGREGPLAGLSGWDAVKLWKKWSERGDEVALDTLIAYNLADFENLEPLASYACETLKVQTLAGVATQSRLTLMPDAPARPAGP